MSEIMNARYLAAEAAYEEFEFNDESIPVAANGWENDGSSMLRRVIFVVDEADPSAPSKKGEFNVEFDEGSSIPTNVWANVDGNDIGRRPVSVPPAPRM